MPKISVVVMTLNEELKINRCLTSVKEIADEILVVDSYSTDRTEEISKKFGARFIQHPFQGYIEQRQYCVDNARYDHVLVLDADEELSETLKEEILKVKQNWIHDGYDFNRLNSFCGKWIRHSGWYPDRKLRLFDRRKASVKGRNPHDEVKLFNGASKKHIKGDLLHYTYLTVEDQINQINRFTGIQARDRFEKGKNASYLSILFSPVFKFLRHYVALFGFLDGYYGYLLCRNMAYSTFLKHAKLKALWKMEKLKNKQKK
jgi:glycosyltransferase involved in cell wall biosynthesis